MMPAPYNPSAPATTPAPRQRGIVAVLAMMFLVIFSSLAAAMAIVAQGNLQTAEGYRHVNRSLVAAETGIHYFTWQVDQITRTREELRRSEGLIDEDLADQIWPTLRDIIIEEIGEDAHYLDTHDIAAEAVTFGRVLLGSTGPEHDPTYQISMDRHPIPDENYNAPMYQRAPYNVGGGDNRFTPNGEAVTGANPIDGRWVRVRSVGRDRDYARSIQMDFQIDKRIRYAVLSRNRVMIGRNVLIEGSIGSQYIHTEYAHGHPVQMLDDFRGLDSTLDSWLQAFTQYLAAYDASGNNRIRVDDPRESGALADAESLDVNHDGYVDAYDFFLLRFGDGETGIPMDNFRDGSGDLIDPELWQLLNESQYPPGTEFDWHNYRIKLPGDVWRNGTTQLTNIRYDDPYAKIRGEVVMSASREQWEDGAAMGPYHHYFKGPLVPDEDRPPLQFEAPDNDLGAFDLDNIDVSTYRDRVQSSFLDHVGSPDGSVVEEVPYQAAHPYDYYDRPVYEGYTFENVMIPMGTNAVFKNCTFRGVTFVETHPDNDDPTFNITGAQLPDGSLMYEHLEIEIDGQTVNSTKPFSNNIRFHNTVFEGSVVTEPPSTFAQKRNKLQFTGWTRFDLDSSYVGDDRQFYERSTLLAPHYSIDMGTFTDPANPNMLMRLEGTIVAGVFDIRGQATVDGSVVTTYMPEPDEGPLAHGGSPAAMNTTIGYFGSVDGDVEAEVPAEGLGKIIIRHDPDRAMPDGIEGPIELRPQRDTYLEGAGR